jgi:hypothetical protein
MNRVIPGASPQLVSAMYGSSDKDAYYAGMIDQHKRQHEMCQRLGTALSKFLCAVSPMNSGVAQELGDALTAFLDVGYEEQLEALEVNRSAPSPVFPMYPPPSVEQLASLCKQRDVMQSQIDGVYTMIDSMDEDNPGRKMLEGQIKVMGLDTALESINERISEMQKALETESTPERVTE